jgi:hypothetical protein
MQTYGEVELQLYEFVTSARDGCECLASHPSRFTPEERNPNTCCIGGRVGSRAGLDAVEREKSCPA